ncbi:MAG: hypothetical protein NVS2B7_30340 [Herpetosiphon sp.]
MTVFLSFSYSVVDNVLRPLVTQSVRDPWVREAIIVLGMALLGAALGLAQAVILRPYLQRTRTWALTTAACLWLGGSLAELAAFSGVAIGPSLALSALLLGPGCGLLQWLILRKEVARAGWWVLVQTLGWVVVFVVAAGVAGGAAVILGGNGDAYLPLSYAVGGAALGTLDAAVLSWLLHARPRW